ncbi:phage gp16-like protein [Dyella sp. SG562]|uniref:regulatory protein GemA n=1 Tax=Dyella sp. SG562 TaxID=2587017 RepID=UPI001423065F|nr:regulatory protein GemA [Dyella sp. SG562]NII74231.1 phage gp16-like protein [Dyella sp. SG562]
MRKFDPATTRTRQLAAIHVIANKQLRLDRETYVGLLQRIGGVSSSADLDERGRVRVLKELRRLTGEGDRQMANAVAMPDAPQTVRDEIASMVSKVAAILAEIDKPWSYAHGTARRMFKVQRVEWLRADQLHRLVAALQISANRRK